ncbi:hypothetical protein FXF50_05170 [Micromonospora sp. AP08]|uniref:hypothetical protein n=1 Tax=Micromonospora sp. AP08 TaxID=2604467 RepID=UPI0011DBE3BF|nr:hypothetical protein [Micromonospora sp. AP08]TYB39769.1 hypothetical protein FXF50_05170 [Micromonospora sp. AP08]
MHEQRLAALLTTRTRRRAGLSAAALLLVAGLLLPAAAVAASDAPPADAGGKPVPTGTSDPSVATGSARRIMAAQTPLLAAATRIKALAGDEGSGLSGISLDVERRRVHVWWKGSPPTRVTNEIARQRRTGVAIDVRPGRYSERELRDAARTVLAHRAAYPGLLRIGPRYDGTGLEAVVDRNGTRIAAGPPLAFPVPTRVVVGPAAKQMGRVDDTAPFWAGGVARPVGSSNRCSTGFAVIRYFLWWESMRGLLTAEHCSFGGNVGFTTGVGTFIGTAGPPPTAQSAPHSDSLIITTSSTGAAARTFDGGVGVGEFSKPVVGRADNFPGQFVCTSGAATGAHCDIRLTAINQVVILEPSFTIAEGVALGTQISGGPAVGAGDSGGPVFTLAADPAKVLAAGMIVGGLGPVSCGNPQQSGCLNQVAYVDMGYLLVAHQVSLLTS